MGGRAAQSGAARTSSTRSSRACKRDGTLARLAERYFARRGEVAAHRRRRACRSGCAACCPQYRPLFQRRAGRDRHRVAAARRDRLPGVAVGPVGDQRNRRARLHADHRGHGAAPRRRRPARSRARACSAPARYLRDLKAKLPARIPEPDRTWLALAAFNIGLGHLEDARILAQKQKLNPDLWTRREAGAAAARAARVLREGEDGYARGGMPVAFVDRVRAYYDILLRAGAAAPAAAALFADAHAGDRDRATRSRRGDDCAVSMLPMPSHGMPRSPSSLFVLRSCCRSRACAGAARRCSSRS